MVMLLDDQGEVGNLDGYVRSDYGLLREKLWEEVWNKEKRELGYKLERERERERDKKMISFFSFFA
jgi:hypothetical protein